jgi:pSer/pThr/pTyr-binding forkhead associated (FHA) protein
MWILKTADDSVMFRLLPGAIRTLGRAAHADFGLDAGLVSRLHCRLTVTKAGELQVQDLQSTNGTFVNGRRVVQAVLAPGDRLSVGRVDLQVERASEGPAEAGRYEFTRNGFVRRSVPIVVIGPWPGYTSASSPNANNTSLIDRISVA